MVSGSDYSSSWPNRVGLRVKPEFPIWTSDSRIVRFSCPRHNEFCRKRRLQREIARFYCAKSCETGLSECGNLPNYPQKPVSDKMISQDVALAF
jgi:hypothetical protein